MADKDGGSLSFFYLIIFVVIMTNIFDDEDVEVDVEVSKSKSEISQKLEDVKNDLEVKAKITIENAKKYNEETKDYLLEMKEKQTHTFTKDDIIDLTKTEEPISEEPKTIESEKEIEKEKESFKPL